MGQERHTACQRRHGAERGGRGRPRIIYSRVPRMPRWLRQPRHGGRACCGHSNARLRVRPETPVASRLPEDATLSRAGFAGRGMTFALSNVTPHARFPTPTRDAVSGRLP